MSDDSRPHNPAANGPGHGSAQLLDAALACAVETRVARFVREIGAAIGVLPRADLGGIGLYDPELEMLRRFVLDPRDPDAAGSPLEIRHEESELNLLGASPKTYRSPALTTENAPAALQQFADVGMRHYLAVPLMLGERLVGCIFACLKDTRGFTDEEVDYLERLARLTAPSAFNCVTQERFHRGDLRRDTLRTLSAEINASPEFDAVLSAAREAIGALADDAGCSIDLLEPDGRQYRVYRAGGTIHPLPDTADGSLLFPVGDSALAWVHEQHRTYESADLTEDTRFRVDRMLRDAGIRRYIMVPMIVHGDVIGAIFMGSTSPLRALRIDVWLYENIALQVGLAIENARQLTQLQNLSERLTQQNVYLREEINSEHDYSEMVGRTVVMDRLRESITRVARTDSTVLITGQTGVGKELVARAIHGASARADQPMVKVNCAAIPETMVESELFGHERGAFTSAVAQRIGRFELAHDGTLFLDEIGELSLSVQAKLLRVLQDGEFERVGGSKTVSSNVRIIAATNRDLLATVQAGNFRSDLYYRLNVFPIHVASLEERREDIPLLVEAFIAQFSRRMGKQFDSIDPQSLEAIVNRPWPGNIRELRHVVERAMILCDGRVLHIETAGQQRSAKPAPEQPHSPTVDRSLNDVEAEHIKRVLTSTNNVIEGRSGAAAILGLKPSTLRSRMKRLGISRASGNPR